MGEAGGNEQLTFNGNGMIEQLTFNHGEWTQRQWHGLTFPLFTPAKIRGIQNQARKLGKEIKLKTCSDGQVTVFRGNGARISRFGRFDATDTLLCAFATLNFLGLPAF